MLMRITPITGTIGAELSGLDLKQPISEDLEQALRAALEDFLGRGTLRTPRIVPRSSLGALGYPNGTNFGSILGAPGPSLRTILHRSSCQIASNLPSEADHNSIKERF